MNPQDELDYVRQRVLDAELWYEPWNFKFATPEHVLAVIIGLNRAAGESLPDQVGIDLVRGLCGYGPTFISRQQMSSAACSAILEWLYGPGVQNLKKAMLLQDSVRAVRYLVARIRADHSQESEHDATML